jgi:hypothetical protein
VILWGRQLHSEGFCVGACSIPNGGGIGGWHADGNARRIWSCTLTLLHSYHPPDRCCSSRCFGLPRCTRVGPLQRSQGVRWCPAAGGGMSARNTIERCRKVHGGMHQACQVFTFQLSLAAAGRGCSPRTRQ